MRGPWTLAWQSANLSLGDARNLENRLKRQGRGKGFYSITGLPRKTHNPAAEGRGFKSRPRNQMRDASLSRLRFTESGGPILGRTER